MFLSLLCVLCYAPLEVECMRIGRTEIYPKAFNARSFINSSHGGNTAETIKIHTKSEFFKALSMAGARK